MRYSGAGFEMFDSGFASVVDRRARLVKVVDSDAHEGPVYVPREDALYFTTRPRFNESAGCGSPVVSIKRLELDGDRFPLNDRRSVVVRKCANGANGMALGLDGRLIVCEQGTTLTPARVSAVDIGTGHAETVITGWLDSPFNSPNDVAVKDDGTIWFTDPSYGHLQGFKPPPTLGDNVYRYDPRSGTPTIVAQDFDKPNGLTFSPCKSVVYIGDSGANHEEGTFDACRPHHIRAFDIMSTGELANGRIFAVIDSGYPDGLTVDTDGRVYSSAFDGVHVFSPEGSLLGKIRLRGAVNFTFGGADHNILFITTDSAVWAAVLNVEGA
jgi:gluconolactonase